MARKVSEKESDAHRARKPIAKIPQTHDAGWKWNASRGMHSVSECPRRGEENYRRLVLCSVENHQMQQLSITCLRRTLQIERVQY
eukprot:590199-Rhodomonas_salina.2